MMDWVTCYGLIVILQVSLCWEILLWLFDFQGVVECELKVEAVWSESLL